MTSYIYIIYIIIKGPFGTRHPLKGYYSSMRNVLFINQVPKKYFIYFLLFTLSISALISYAMHVYAVPSC